MNRLASVRVRLVGIVFLAVAPCLTILFFTDRSASWVGFGVGLAALAAAWFGGELFILRQVRALLAAVKGVAAGNLATRTGLSEEKSELGELARSFDQMAIDLERQVHERELGERALLNRALQQTVLAALGQFALVASDMSALLNQAVLLISQTLDVEYSSVMELQPDGQSLVLTAGSGWKEGCVGSVSIPADKVSQAGFTLASGEPVMVRDLGRETRFQVPQFLIDHGVVTSVTIVIQGHRQPFGVLGIATTRERVFPEDDIHFLMATATALAMAVDRHRTEPELEKLAAFAKFNPNAVLEFSHEGNLTFYNDAALKMAATLGEKHPEAVLPADAAGIVQTCLATGQNRLHLETRRNGRILSWSFYPIMAGAAVHCYVEDTTERNSLEEQLRQAQKMESVGQLAAGVAHDFNNILTIIQGHSGLLMSRPNLSPAMTTSVQAVSFAAERATSLTRQLLMFSRKQVMQPKLLDLKEVVTNLSKMLQRLIGETVLLSVKCAPKLPLIEADTGMMEQVLMNLSVNARDAMPRGGHLVIQADPATIDENYVRMHTDAKAGLYLRLQVSDTGTGMDAVTMKRIFEPFFTTKGTKGTGLGLATVYGIVRQHAGWIEVESEVGAGTTFRIFLPASPRQEREPETEQTTISHVTGGHETILVVEDEPVLRDLAQLILQDCGYRVLEAGSGVEALTVWQKHKGDIDLLLTDMIMPDGLSGKDLAESLLTRKPSLKIIFTSGYNVDDIGTDLPDREKMKFLQKPYSRSTLARAVRECLDK
jgi:signal transduction histidine kinase/HAMP domain-containing protein/ActR/RegA family two-component response regulator